MEQKNDWTKVCTQLLNALEASTENIPLDEMPEHIKLAVIAGRNALAASNKEIETVDCIASGYEWECPKCGHLNKIDAWTETAICQDYHTPGGCKTVVKLNLPVHVSD